MIQPDFANVDEVLEYAAQLIEESSLLDFCRVTAKRKRAREDAELRYQARQELRAEMAGHLRAMKSRRDLDAITVLRKLSELADNPYQHVMHLRDAWPLAWKGWLSIECTIRCNDNCIPPESNYRITLTDDGRAILAAQIPEAAA